MAIIVPLPRTYLLLVALAQASVRSNFSSEKKINSNQTEQWPRPAVAFAILVEILIKITTELEIIMMFRDAAENIIYCLGPRYIKKYQGFQFYCTSHPYEDFLNLN